jgi:hypothetical protein
VQDMSLAEGEAAPIGKFGRPSQFRQTDSSEYRAT